jgi:WD40 repeat protein
VAEDFFEWCDQSGIGQAQWIWGAPLNYPAVAFSPDSKAVWCATGLGATAVVRWQPQTKKADVIWPVPGRRIENLVVDQARNWVAAIVGGEREPGWMIWNAGMPDAMPFVFATPDTCRAIAIHPKSPEVAFAVGRTVRTVNVSTKTEAKPLEVSEPADELKFSADGRWLAVSAASFSVWDVDRREKRFELPTAQGPNRTEIACEKIVDFDDQGRIWAIVFAPGSHPVKRSLVRFDADGKTWETLIADLHTLGPVQPASAVISPDRRQLALLSQEKSANEMESIRIWHIAEGNAKRLGGNKKHVGSMAFSPDGTKLASVSHGGGPLKVWELSQAKEKLQASGK